jgi:hypothetical protein
LNCNFYTHRKTAKLRALIGDDAFWLPPRWWAYAAENQPDGIFKDYTAPEIAALLGYQKDPLKMLEALLQAGFADANPLRIHDWQDFNGYHLAYSARAKNAATVRWQKERTKEKETEKRGEEKSQALLGASNVAESQQMLGKSLPIFEPVPRGLYQSAYAAMITDAKEQLKKAEQRFVDKVLTAPALSFIAWVEANETDPDQKVKKIKSVKADPKNYTTTLTAEGEAHKKCWQVRIEEIQRAKRGEK